ncbi:hypothetical protein HJC23_007081 [Cyclotella cryptica]|uniref:Uncharacterized protein n=1 Tax=Cyclotella cryptica TaxID=29204 RepID=A0ABD3NWA5_9STRA|eukprot:CCRYP_019347-RA/>CCRYP_019347-RA protein AED:0.04 eAED:0.02 QI:0/0/0/1/1/1/2/0/285
MTAMRHLTAATAATVCLILHAATAFNASPPHFPPTKKCADNQRRHLLQSTAAALVLLVLRPPPSIASEPLVAPQNAPVEEVTMKPFVDKLFTIQVPSRFFAIRRSAKGDLPDVKTGKGRRGGTIFTAGDMGKAEVIAVERFPTRALLEDEGYTPSGDLTTFSSIGEPTAIATLLLRRREKDKPGTQNTAVLDTTSVALSDDGMTLTFTLRQQINVEKPELLMETMGVSELYRTTLAKATLTSRDGQIMAVFASALDQDFQGVDGVALKRAVDSFVALDQSLDVTS